MWRWAMGWMEGKREGEGEGDGSGQSMGRKSGGGTFAEEEACSLRMMPGLMPGEGAGSIPMDPAPTPFQ